jgi:DNA-binding transcriptional LysR family regulator
MPAMDSSLTSRIWPWLPVFRAVAETEHLPTAARRLHLTTPALSRTVRLLEEALGQPVFDRVGRRIVLNQAGRLLLDATRHAMIRVQDALAALDADPTRGPLRVSALGVLTHDVVLDALLDLKARYPDLDPHLLNLRTRDANEALLAGELELAFYYEPVTVEGLDVAHLGDLGASVYCGRSHPLFGVDAPLPILQAHAFSVPAVGDTGRVMDGWPVHLSRRIGLRITLLTSNLQVALSGRFLTVLPDITAAPHLKAGDLWRFRADVIPPIPVFVARRGSAGREGPARELVEVVRGRLDPLDRILGERTTP